MATSKKTQEVAVEETKEPIDFEAVVEQWFREFVHNSRVSQHTDVYNELRASVDVLKSRVK